MKHLGYSIVLQSTSSTDGSRLHSAARDRPSLAAVASTSSASLACLTKHQDMSKALPVASLMVTPMPPLPLLLSHLCLGRALEAWKSYLWSFPPAHKESIRGCLPWGPATSLLCLTEHSSLHTTTHGAFGDERLVSLTGLYLSQHIIYDASIAKTLLSQKVRL
jgi:hypothetical protein